jgi:hypothetical protein
VASGTIIGSRIRRKDVERMRELKRPVLIVHFGMLLYNLVFGLLCFCGGVWILQRPCCLRAPGGTSDLTLNCAGSRSKRPDHRDGSCF